MSLITGKYRADALVLFCGLIVPLGFAPLQWYPVPLLALAVLVAVLHTATPARGAWLGWLFGMGQFSAGVSWVYISVYFYGGDAGLSLSLLVMMLLVAYLSLFPALMAWLVSRCRTSAAGRYLLIFPAAWFLSEWMRSWVFTGFPWLNLGYSQIESPLAGYAPLLGAYGIGWLTALSAGALALLVSGRPPRRIAAIMTLLLVWSAGFGLAQIEWTQKTGQPFDIAIVQGNIPQDLKWKPEQQALTLETYVALTREHLDVDLVIWPETAIPSFYDQVEHSFIQPLAANLAQENVSLITGIPMLDREKWDYYNAIISLEQPGEAYRKVHLVPFGEYLPLRDWLASVLDFLPIPEADFNSGELDQPLLHAAGYPFGASICYEIAFGEQLIHALPEAAYLVNVSNDAWFGDSLAPHQQLEMARMRAREVERYLLRATNTGISAVIDERGEIVVRSQQFVAESIRSQVQPRAGATPYVRVGNLPLIIAAALVLLGCWIRKRRKTPAL